MWTDAPQTHVGITVPASMALVDTLAAVHMVRREQTVKLTYMYALPISA